ncbi:major capsid protein P2 [Pseudoalteromonas luteoviolacea]|uniref:Capsid protein n=1 Tax=Pseudoalteromonas luteoviolacea NCIMB 1942 TaxID=1365253 RepID=A0A167AZ46_9GAMM|nr:major capsid protein P2 [Pseudoalteromonas luteoviolacea]KZN45969.1 capsid protein [Pseudoalteromonas luteoviolacea NCIMB 1942]
MLEITKLNNITGVSEGGSVSLSLPIGRTYEKVHFQIENVASTEIKNIRVELNGRLLTEWSTLADMLEENAYFKRKQLDGYATMYFTRPEVEGIVNPSLVAQRFFALGTQGLSIVQIKFDIGVAEKDQQQNPKTPVVAAFAEKTRGSAPGWLFKRRVFRYNLNTGINEIENLPRPSGSQIALIEIKKTGNSSVLIKDAEFLVNNVKWREAIPKSLHNHIIDQRGRAPQGETFAIDLSLSGDVFSSLVLDPSISDMRLRVNCEGSGGAEVIVHYFDDYKKSTF